MKRLGIGVVGCGSAAHDLCRAVDALPDAYIAAVHDPVEAAARALAAPRGATVHTDLAALLAEPVVDVVYVAVPHDRLEPIAARALEANRHVLVEKPVALDVAGIRRLHALARGADPPLRLGVMFELREVGAIGAAGRLLRDGAIGRVVQVRIRTVIDKPQSYWQSGPGGRVADGWRRLRARAGGGVVLMNAIHQLDLVAHLTGETFVRASGEVATLVAADAVEVEDSGAAVLRLSGGAIASLVAAAHSPGARLDERIEIDGTDGRIDLPDPYGDGPLRVYVREARDGLEPGWNELAIPRGDPHARLVEGFLAAVRGASAVPVGASDAAGALATVEAIYRSGATGTTEPVEQW